MNATEPLPRGQQMYLQQLVARHCVSCDEANKMFRLLMTNDYATQDNDEDDDEDDDDNPSAITEKFMGRGIKTPEDAFVSINRQLKPGFGLEIVSLVDSQQQQQGGGGDGDDKTNIYVAVVNTMVDDIVKKETIFAKSWNPHERAFIRLVMQALVDQLESDNEDDEEEEDDENDNDEDEGQNSKKSSGGGGGIRRADLINLRSDLENGFKLTLDQATRVVGILIEEQWLRVSLLSPRTNLRRESVQAKIELAPRSYLELSHYLIDIGLDNDKLPQFLFHRD